MQGANPIPLPAALATAREQLERMAATEQWGRISIVVERGRIKMIELARTVRGEQQLRGEPDSG